MDNILFVSLSSLDNDTRILKSIRTLKKSNYTIESISNGTHKFFDFNNYNINYRAKRYFGIPKIGKVYLWFKILRLLSKLNLKEYSIIHCNDLNTLPIGYIIKKFYNKDVKIVYDAHEYETEINGLSGVQKSITKRIERFLIKHADAVICVSNAIAEEYVKLYSIKKPALVLNTPALTTIVKKDMFRETLGIAKEKTIFLYQGGLSRGRGIEILIDAFKQINDDKSVIVFMGYGVLAETIKNTSKEYDNIYFHEAVSPEVLLEYTSSADFGILFYENSCLNHYFCSPNKMFEYLMAELPVIVSNLYEMKRLVEDNNIGVVAKENTPTGLRESIEEATKLDSKELEVNIQRVRHIYNWEEQEKVLISLYKGLK